MPLRAARQRALLECPEGALPTRRAGRDGRTARGAVRKPAARLASRSEPARRDPGDRPRRLPPGRVEHGPALSRDTLGRHPDLSVRPARSRHRQLAARLGRDVPAPHAAPDRGSGLRVTRRRAASAPSRPPPTVAGPPSRPRCRNSSASRACSTRPRHGLVAGASRSPTSPRRPCSTDCAAAATRWPPCRASRPGPRPAARARPGSASRRRRASSVGSGLTRWTGRPAGRPARPRGAWSQHELLRHPGPLKPEQEGRRAESLDVLAHLASTRLRAADDEAAACRELSKACRSVSPSGSTSLCPHCT